MRRNYNNYKFDDDFENEYDYEDDDFDNDNYNIFTEASFIKYELEEIRDKIEEEKFRRNQLIQKNKFPNFKNEYFMKCPLCSYSIQNSEYLADVFENQPYVYWSACLLTHYRHSHINYYDASWKNPYYAEKNREYYKMSHDEYKTLVNNRAKRQMIRGLVKNTVFDKETKKELIEGFLKLQFNDEKTKALIERKIEILCKKKIPRKKGKNKKKH